MFKKKFFIFALAFLLCFFNLSPLNAGSGVKYTYRSTVFGTGLNSLGSDIFSIAGEKNSFSVNEDIYSLTRIFNITNVNSFQFRAELYRSGGFVRDWYSPYWQPNRHWWQEVYTWNNYGKLTAGNYELRVFLNVDEAGYKQVDTKYFRVDGRISNYSPVVPEQTSYYNYPAAHSNSRYIFRWTRTGNNVKNSYSWVYEVVNPRTNFLDNENVGVVTYLSDINNVDNFQIKYELFLNGSNFYRGYEFKKMYPGGNNWRGNYAWHNFGPIPSGTYILKTYIRVDDGGWVLLNDKEIRVSRQQINKPRTLPVAGYGYDWTLADNKTRQVSSYVYTVDNPRTCFTTDEPVVVLTKLKDINNIDRFRIKHELYLNGGSLFRTLIAPEQRPMNKHWDYNYTENNFGKLPAGEHKIKTYILMDGNAWQLLDTIDFSVVRASLVCGYDYCGSTSYFDYKWTKVLAGE